MNPDVFTVLAMFPPPFLLIAGWAAVYIVFTTRRDRWFWGLMAWCNFALYYIHPEIAA